MSRIVPEIQSKTLATASTDRYIVLRWGFLLLLLAAEILFLSIRFDTIVLSESDSWLARLAGDLPVYLRIGLAALASFLVIVYPRLTAFLKEARDAARQHHWLLWLPVQLVVYAGFFQLTTRVFGLASAKTPPPDSLLTGWAATGLAVFLVWLLTLAPFRYWLNVAVRERVALLVALLAGVAAWGLGEIAHTFWEPLALATFIVSRFILRLFYDDVLYDLDDHTLGTPEFMVNVAPACSGYEGVGLVTVFLGIYLWMFRDTLRFPQSFLLFPIGALAIWLANAVRISSLIALGTSYSREVAMGGFHSQAGWIAFSAIALGLIVLTRRLQLFSSTPVEPAAVNAEGQVDDSVSDMASALLLPLLVLMASVMLTQAFTHGFDWLYPLRPILTAAVLWHYRDVYRQWDWSWTATGPLVGVLVFVMWMLMEPKGDDAVLGDALHALPQWQQSLWLAFRVLGSVMLVPVIEEMAFRGYLLRRLVAADFENVSPRQFTWLSFVASSLIFGLVHGRWLAGTLAGMAYALAVYRHGKLGDAVVAHTVTNGLIALTAIVLQQWSLWS